MHVFARGKATPGGCPVREDERTRELRQRLVEKLKAEGQIRTPAVEKAFLAVPRHLFVPPEVTAEEAYRDEVISLLPGVSTLSQPSIVALMLEELAVEAGSGVLEIGTASGYNAALLSCLTGDPALVHTVEIDPHLARQAQRNLERAGYGGVRVRAGDGSLGWAEAAPFTRIVLTAEADSLDPTLLGQLAGDGLLLAPFAFPGFCALLLRLGRKRTEFRGEFLASPVSFVPLRGEGGVEEDERRPAARLVREALRVVDQRGMAAEPLSLNQRLALYLITAAAAERPGSAATEAAEEGWRRFAAAGLPELERLAVALRPGCAEENQPGELSFKRREGILALELPAERNPGKGGESPSREVVQ